MIIENVVAVIVKPKRG